MVNKDSIHNDGFYELLKLQHDTPIPSGLESSIMHKIELNKDKKSFPIRLNTIFIFGIASSLYVIIAILATYFYPHISELKDVKMIIGLGLLSYCFYEINETFPLLLNHFTKKRALKL